MDISYIERKQLIPKVLTTVDLQKKVVTEKNQIFSLTIEVTDLKKKVTAHEKHTNRNCIIFQSFPRDAFSMKLETDISEAIKIDLEVEVTAAAFKACRPMRKILGNHQ